MSKWMITLFFLIGAACLTHFIPFSSFFRNVDTLIHEMSHAGVTLLLSGKVLSMNLLADHSGVTYSSVTREWTLVPIGLSGYIGSALFTLLLFYLYRHGQYRLALAIVTAVALTAWCLFVRNDFGRTWLIGFASLNGIAFLLGGLPGRFYLLMVSFLALEESVWGTLQLALYSVHHPEHAGDASQLGRITDVPAPWWAFGFLLFSLWCAKGSIGLFTRRGRR